MKLFWCLIFNVLYVHAELMYFNPSEEFSSYKKKYNLIFETDDVKRLNIFTQNLKRMNQMNVESKGNAVFGITQFSHLTQEEFASMYTSSFNNDSLRSHISDETCGMHDPSILKIFNDTDSFDWRNINGKSYVTKVKDQGQCGSCVAFAVTAAVENIVLQNFPEDVYNVSTLDISEQDLLDCTPGNQCAGAAYYMYLDYFACKGFRLESENPYRSTDSDNCPLPVQLYNQRPMTPKNIPYFYTYSTSIDSIRNAVQNGLVMIAIDASPLQFYKSGIIDCSYGFNVNHAVPIVGFKNNVSGVDMWIVKNSWGTNWGDHGYFYMRKDCPYSPGVGGSLNMYVQSPKVFVTTEPRTAFPTTSKPTTLKPTIKPTTARPTLRPTTARPTLWPTTARPTPRPTSTIPK